MMYFPKEIVKVDEYFRQNHEMPLIIFSASCSICAGFKNLQKQRFFEFPDKH